MPKSKSPRKKYSGPKYNLPQQGTKKPFAGYSVNIDIADSDGSSEDNSTVSTVSTSVSSSRTTATSTSVSKPHHGRSIDPDKVNELIGKHDENIKSNPLPDTEVEYRKSTTPYLAVGMTVIVLIVAGLAALAAWLINPIFILSAVFLTAGIGGIIAFITHVRWSRGGKETDESKWDDSRVSREKTRKEAHARHDQAMEDAQAELGDVLERVNRANPAQAIHITSEGIVQDGNE